VDAEWFVAPEYWLARQILQRGVAVVYLIAFIGAARQFRALIGEHGNGFKGKPGDPQRWPRQWAPYHLRLDWLMWFAALTPHHAGDWLGPFVIRLLQNDAPTLRLLRHNPFPESPPRYVRAQLYEYRFTSWDELRRERLWWRRTVVGEYLPPIALGTGQSLPHGLPY
jgi:hypothetical protein